MLYLDLAELEGASTPLARGLGLGWRPVHYRRSDYLGDPRSRLSESVRDVVGAFRGEHHDGPVRLLGQVRTFGWCFNPVALYYCFARGGERVSAVVASVTNTPWKERFDYVLEADTAGYVDKWVDKQMHVSPFMSMDQSYHFELHPPGSSIWARVTNHEGNETVSRAVMSLERRPLDEQALSEFVRRHPLTTWRVSAGIYRQALELYLKGVPFRRHPDRCGGRRWRR